MQLSSQKDISIYQSISKFLLLILTLRIVSYLTVSESILITRGIKIGLRLILSGVLFLIFLKIKKRRDFVKAEFVYILPIVFYSLYLFFGTTSILWSSLPSYSLLQVLMDIESLVFSVLLIYIFVAVNSVLDIRLDRVMAYAVTLVGLSFVIGMFISPDDFYRGTHGGEVHRLGGFIINPNELGMLMVVGLASFLNLWSSNSFTKLEVFSFVLIFVVLWLTGSRSSFFGFVLTGAVFIKRQKSMVWTVTAIAVSIVAAPFVINNIIIKQGDISEVMNMTGRLPFWGDLLRDGFTKEPIKGFGFMRISYHDKFESIHAYAGAMTHNTFLQVLLNLGLIGMFIVILQMTTTFKALSATNSVFWNQWGNLLLIPLIINSLTEFGIFGESNFGILFYQIVFIGVSIKHIERNEHQVITS